MRYYYILFILTLLFNDFSHSQGTQEFGKIFKKSENQAPIADAGEDIKVTPGGTVTISGDKSGDPNGDVLQFEWSLPPSLMEKENYIYDKSDTVKTHKGKNQGSVDVIKTYTQTFQLDIPEALSIGSKVTACSTQNRPMRVLRKWDSTAPHSRASPMSRPNERMYVPLPHSTSTSSCGNE